MKKPEQPAGTDRKSHIFPKPSPMAARLTGSYSRAMVIGLHPVSGVLVGGAAGYFLWKRFDAAWVFWVLLLVGFVAGCLNAYRDIRKMMREEG